MMAVSDSVFGTGATGSQEPKRCSVVNETVRLLVIEDGPDAGLSASPHLTAGLRSLVGDDPDRGDGFSWVGVRSLDEAMMQLRSGPIDAILVDQGDIDAIAGLQAHAPGVPVLVCTDDVDTDKAQEAIVAGAEDVLLPAEVTAEKLKRRVKLAIARKAFMKERLRHARQDPLTGLANSMLLEERFSRAVARTERNATLVGLVAIDLDGFDLLIDRYGPTTTDRLLPMVSQRFLRETRQTDTLARSRDHGFTWLVEGLASVHDINALVNRLPAQLTQPFSINDRPIRLTASVGVAIFPLHGRCFQSLRSLAEAAMIDVSALSGDGLLMPPIPPAMSTASM